MRCGAAACVRSSSAAWSGSAAAVHTRPPALLALSANPHRSCRRHEDALSLALRSGEADPDSTSDLLCLTTAKHCEQPLAAEEAARAAAEAAEVEVTHAQLEAAQAAADAADTEQQAGAEGAEQQAGADAAAGTAAGSTAGSVKQEGKEEL